jgi:hypothetical protein
VVVGLPYPNGHQKRFSWAAATGLAEATPAKATEVATMEYFIVKGIARLC